MVGSEKMIPFSILSSIGPRPDGAMSQLVSFAASSSNISDHPRHLKSIISSVQPNTGIINLNTSIS